MAGAPSCIHVLPSWPLCDTINCSFLVFFRLLFELTMRFRGTLAKDALGVLLDAAQALARLGAAGGACVVTVSPESMTLALRGPGEELQSFARLQLARLFLDVLVESLADNHIAFSCDVRHLHQALTSGKDSSAVMLRLLRRGDRSLLCLRTRVGGATGWRHGCLKDAR